MYVRNAHYSARYAHAAKGALSIEQPKDSCRAAARNYAPDTIPDMPIAALLRRLADRLDDTRSGVDTYAAGLAIYARQRAAAMRA